MGATSRASARARAAPAITRALSDPSRAQTFALFDKDGGGTIDAEELGSLMRALGHSLEQHEIDELVKRADADNSGEIDFAEFCALMAEELMKFDDRAELKLIFDKLDHSGNGEINAKELRRIFDAIGGDEQPSDQEIQEMIYEVDLEGRDAVTFREFEKLAIEIGMFKDPGSGLVAPRSASKRNHRDEEGHDA